MLDGSHIITDTYLQPAAPSVAGTVARSTDSKSEKKCVEGTKTYRLEELAFLRSGDKGNSANIGT